MRVASHLALVLLQPLIVKGNIDPTCPEVGPPTALGVVGERSLGSRGPAGGISGRPIRAAQVTSGRAAAICQPEEWIRLAGVGRRPSGGETQALSVHLGCATMWD